MVLVRRARPRVDKIFPFDQLPQAFERLAQGPMGAVLVAVKHGLVPVANQYRWCSAAWFERTASPAQVKTIYRFKIDRVQVDDDF